MTLPPCAITRRTFARLLASVGFIAPRILPVAAAQSEMAAYRYPLSMPGQALGDGFRPRHGYACENTWFFPGYWHTGEDWYLLAGDTGGAHVHAVAAGEVVFAGSDYPGRVIIVQHDDGLFSMYGHLDYALAVATGQRVGQGDVLGTVLVRNDGRAPSHLHFEIRTFLTTPEVNGAAPRYGFNCGVECPPGPGYWPIDAPEHPSAMGWRNPTHVVNRRAWAGGAPAATEVAVAAGAPSELPLWSAPPGADGAAEIARQPTSPGDRFPLLAIATGPEDGTGTSAEAYQVWYQLGVITGGSETAWAQAVIPSLNDTGSDGRPSSVALVLVPWEMGDG